MRRLVICADGTWNTPDKQQNGVPTPTNVMKMARAVCPVADDGASQIVYYQSGVGTGFGLLDKVLGGGLGVGLDRNICDCYRFLVDNHQTGDQIFLFGFSRGAFTARSLGGLIRKCGVLRPNETHRIPEAFRFYRGDVHPNDAEAVRFRAAHSTEVDIQMIGVWDTVGSLGIPGRLRVLARRKYEFHDVTLSSRVRNAFHALSIDEKRRAFAPTLWGTAPNPGQNFEQVWFAGVHSNVGGGYEDAGLSDLAFAWMVEKARAAGLGFDLDYVAERIRGNAAGRLYDSYSRLWQPMGRFDRDVGKPVLGKDGTELPSNQSVHASVYERIERVNAKPDGPYTPRLNAFAR